MTLLHRMVAMPWPGKHTCHKDQECQFCEMSVLWYQLALEIVQKLAPQDPALAPDVIGLILTQISIPCLKFELCVHK